MQNSFLITLIVLGLSVLMFFSSGETIHKLEERNDFESITYIGMVLTWFISVALGGYAFIDLYYKAEKQLKKKETKEP